MKLALDRKRGLARFELSPGLDETALYLAAFAMTADAWVVVGREGRAYTVELKPKAKASVDALKALARGFEAAFAAQAFEAGLNAAPLRAQIVERLGAIHAARRSGAEPAPKGGALAPADAEAIRALLAEEGGGDPLGIAKPWVEQRRRET